MVENCFPSWQLIDLPSWCAAAQYGTKNPRGGHTRHPATHETEIVQPKPNSSPTNTEREKKTASLLPLLTPCKNRKKNEGATIEEPTSVRQVTHPHLAYIPGRLMGHNENTHTMLRSAQLNRGSSQFFPEMSSFLVRGEREFSPAAGRARRTVTPEGNWVFVICNLLCFTEIWMTGGLSRAKVSAPGRSCSRKKETSFAGFRTWRTAAASTRAVPRGVGIALMVQICWWDPTLVRWTRRDQQRKSSNCWIFNAFLR